MAAIELIHKQPVRWTKKRVVSCDGGGGPLGHPPDLHQHRQARDCDLRLLRCSFCTSLDKILHWTSPRSFHFFPCLFDLLTR